MTRPSRYLLIAMSTALLASGVGVFLGMIRAFYAVFANHQTIEFVLGNSIPYNKAMAKIGLLGFILFFVFLVSIVIKDSSDKPH
jgi:hypothetical protein